MADRLRFIGASGFAAVGERYPRKDDAKSWLVWHLTHYENLRDIHRSGALIAGAKPRVSIALQSVTSRRPYINVLPDSNYPAGKTVSDHVPFYFAAKSPMLFTVTRGHQDYMGGAEPLVLLGTSVGTVIDAGLQWCASDQNAAIDVVGFTRDDLTLGEFIDFPLMRQKYWNSTPEDPQRRSRRAAEFLVLDRVPLELISHVITKSAATMDKVHAILPYSGTRVHLVEPAFYF
ncbi:DUF4433 domain-containing protein [Actinosynnema sp. NPDC004786]